ncbi:MAG TPA: hypothetical protein D7I05_01025, partial [Candidatus Poseidoniales archaeon]
MSDTRFRWRTNPTVIARYVMGHHVPSGLEVTLKPNEACVVVEDGRVAGVATQQHMEVNPNVGLLSRMFGREQPNRSFLFVFLGPHDLLFPVEVTTGDGQVLSGLCSMRVAFTRESVSRLLQVPAKGAHEITVAELARVLHPEVIAHLRGVMSSHGADELRRGDGLEDLLHTLEQRMRATLSSYGLTQQSSFMSWNESASQEVLRMRRDLEHLVERNAILDATAAAEMEAALNARVRAAEQEARMANAEASATIAAQGALERARWQELAATEGVQHDARRTQELAEAEHQVKMAQLEAQRQAEQAAPEQAKRDAKVAEATRLFDEVQARKR